MVSLLYQKIRSFEEKTSKKVLEVFDTSRIWRYVGFVHGNQHQDFDTIIDHRFHASASDIDSQQYPGKSQHSPMRTWNRKGTIKRCSKR